MFFGCFFVFYVVVGAFRGLNKSPFPVRIHSGEILKD